MALTSREDFILNEDGDFPLEDNVVNGVYLDTPYGPSDQQHIQDIIVCFPGWVKSYPLIGFGAKRYLNSEASTHTMEKNLRIELQKDGYSCLNGVVAPSNGGGVYINTRFVVRK